MGRVSSSLCCSLVLKSSPGGGTLWDSSPPVSPTFSDMPVLCATHFRSPQDYCWRIRQTSIFWAEVLSAVGVSAYLSGQTAVTTVVIWEGRGAVERSATRFSQMRSASGPRAAIFATCRGQTHQSMAKSWPCSTLPCPVCQEVLKRTPHGSETERRPEEKVFGRDIRADVRSQKLSPICL